MTPTPAQPKSTLLAYFDESGDTGYKGSTSDWFCLSCIMIPAENWSPIMDAVIDRRRKLKQVHGLLMKHELKASELRPGLGPWKELQVRERSRLVVYRSFLQLQHQLAPLGLRTFTMAFNKRKVWASRQVPEYTIQYSWAYALQRVHQQAWDLNRNAIIIVDKGYFRPIRKQVRKIRRHNPTPYMGAQAFRQLKFDALLEDPVDRDSKESYLIQLADLNGFAAHRYLAPRPRFPQDMWLNLGDALLHKVNQNMADRPPAIKVWPPA